ncbi:MAG: hypothetical protein OCU22_01500 [Canidatus Methanoxibalbensis ujae]|nr:hypothetical protein [Candidatus Methanoxibalbensis ujae]
MVKKMKNKNLTTKEKNRNKFAYFRIIFYIIMLSLTNILLAFLISHLSILSIIIALAIVIVLAIWTWRQPFRDNVLYLHNVSYMLGGILLGILAAYWLSSQEKLISFLIPIAIIDFISFTRFGKGTPNRKLIENKTIAKRLSICMPIPGFSGLYQITGIGDMFVFALIVGATLKIWGIHAIWMAISAIIVGQIPNIIGMLSFKNKPWYRGIPATSSPVLIFVTIVLRYSL